MCFHKASNYTAQRFNRIGANTEDVRTNRLVAPVTTSPSCSTHTHTHTPVFTHFLTEPRVLHVNRERRCAEKALTSSMMHLGWLLVVRGCEGELQGQRKKENIRGVNRLKPGNWGVLSQAIVITRPVNQQMKPHLDFLEFTCHLKQ